MGGALLKPRPLHPAALLPPGYRLQAWIRLQLLSYKGLEGSSAHSKFLLEPHSHLLSAASQSCDKRTVGHLEQIRRAAEDKHKPRAQKGQDDPKEKGSLSPSLSPMSKNKQMQTLSQHSSLPQ